MNYAQSTDIRNGMEQIKNFYETISATLSAQHDFTADAQAELDNAEQEYNIVDEQSGAPMEYYQSYRRAYEQAREKAEKEQAIEEKLSGIHYLLSETLYDLQEFCKLMNY